MSVIIDHRSSPFEFFFFFFRSSLTPRFETSSIIFFCWGRIHCFERPPLRGHARPLRAKKSVHLYHAFHLTGALFAQGAFYNSDSHSVRAFFSFFASWFRLVSPRSSLFHCMSIRFCRIVRPVKWFCLLLFLLVKWSSQGFYLFL